jgi:outer membrane protein assembly factor BamB
VFIGSDDHRLYAFSAAGTTKCAGTPKVCLPLWKASAGGSVESSAAIADTSVYAGSGDGWLYAYTIP